MIVGAQAGEQASRVGEQNRRRDDGEWMNTGESARAGDQACGQQWEKGKSRLFCCMHSASTSTSTFVSTIPYLARLPT
jgi:hypothetical protein